MSLETPEKIRTLQRKLYRKAKAKKRHQVQGRGARRVSDEKVFGEPGVLRLRRAHIGPTPWALR